MFDTSTDLVAKTENKFFLKYLIIGLIGLAFAGWSLYDGLVKYPSQLPRAEAWQQMTEEFPTELYAEKWAEIAAKNDWDPKKPKHEETIEYVKQNILFQWLFLAVGLAAAGTCLGWYFRNKSTWIGSDAEGIRSSKGDEVKWSAITKFNKSKWQKKGIAIVHYDSEDGPKKFIIDDLKYERKKTDQIVCLLESKIEAEKIVYGEPEPNNPYG